MKDFYNFASNNPITTIFIVWALCAVPIKIASYICRSRNIAAKGWPPPHLDADGKPQ